MVLMLKFTEVSVRLSLSDKEALINDVLGWWSWLMLVLFSGKLLLWIQIGKITSCILLKKFSFSRPYPVCNDLLLDLSSFFVQEGKVKSVSDSAAIWVSAEPYYVPRSSAI